MQEEQRRIAAELGVAPHLDAAAEIARRTRFLVDYARAAAAKSLVLGISGGVDSSVAGRLCQLAAEQLRSAGLPLRFIAMRLPYGVQADQADAQRALACIFRPLMDTQIGLSWTPDSAPSGRPVRRR